MAKEILCPYCFERTDTSKLLFRCRNRQCSERQPDVIYNKHHGGQEMGKIFVAEKKGLSRFFSNSDKLLSAKCPECNRETTQRACPDCHYQLKYVGNNIGEKMVAIIGGRSSGKSTYISVLINRLENEIGKNFNAGLMADSDRTRKRYKDDFYRPIFVEKRLLGGTVSAGTNPDVKKPMIFRVTFDNQGKRKAVNLVLFDTAGEDMADEDMMFNHAKYIYESDGIIFLLDPFQIEAVRQLIPKNLQDTQKDADPNEIIARLYQLHEDRKKVKNGDKLKKPVAFTLSKSDALSDKDSPIIEPDSSLYRSGEHFGYLNEPDVQSVHTEISTYLEEWMGSSFDNNVRTYFDCYRYFAISSLGSSPVGNKIETIAPLRVEDPLLWVFNQLKIIEAKK